MAIIYTKKGDEILVDDEDFEVLNRFKWHILRSGYVATTLPARHGKGSLYMHRIVCTPPEGMEVDHINVNKKDNRKSNLRACTHAQNCANRLLDSRNTSGFKGVNWDKSRGKWLARIKHGRKQVNLGRYDSAEEAFSVYCRYADRLKGEFVNYG